MLQADSAESRITVPGLVLLPRVTCGPQAAVSARICLQSGFCIRGRHLEHIHICLQRGSALAPWSRSKSNMCSPLASNERPFCFSGQLLENKLICLQRSSKIQSAQRSPSNSNMYLPFAYNDNALVVLLQLARFVLCSLGSLSLRLLVNSINEPGFAVADSSRLRRIRCRVGVLHGLERDTACPVLQQP